MSRADENARPSTSCRVELVVPFHDLDPMQIVWHGNYLKYFDVARSALFDQLGVDFYDIHDRIGCVFPVVKTAVKHIHPLRDRDRFLCKATLVDAHRKLVVDFEITLVKDGTICARGRSEQVAIRADDFALQLQIPDEIRQLLQVIDER